MAAFCESGNRECSYLSICEKMCEQSLGMRATTDEGAINPVTLGFAEDYMTDLIEAPGDCPTDACGIELRVFARTLTLQIRSYSRSKIDEALGD